MAMTTRGSQRGRPMEDNSKDGICFAVGQWNPYVFVLDNLVGKLGDRVHDTPLLIAV